MTDGMAMITFRDHLLLTIKNNLKNIMMTFGRNLFPGQVDVTDSVIANDNVELACAFIQKKAVEKASPELDKSQDTVIELRNLAREEGMNGGGIVNLWPSPTKQREYQTPSD